MDQIKSPSLLRLLPSSSSPAQTSTWPVRRSPARPPSSTGSTTRNWWRTLVMFWLWRRSKSTNLGVKPDSTHVAPVTTKPNVPLLLLPSASLWLVSHPMSTVLWISWRRSSSFFIIGTLAAAGCHCRWPAFNWWLFRFTTVCETETTSGSFNIYLWWCHESTGNTWKLLSSWQHFFVCNLLSWMCVCDILPWRQFLCFVSGWGRGHWTDSFSGSDSCQSIEEG